jgi:hypothetical protein
VLRGTRSIKDAMLALLPLVLFACNPTPSTLEGQVVDVWGNPIEGATVMIVGGTERPLTAPDGRYRLPREAGPIELKAGKKGYIQDQLGVEIPASGEAKGPLFELYPKPDAPGFYGVGTLAYKKIEPEAVKIVGNALKEFRGLADPGEVVLETDTPRIVYHNEIRLDEIVRLKLTMHKMKLIGETEIPGPMGNTKVAVNLFVDDGNVPMEVTPLRSRTDYLIVPTQPLERDRVYVLQTEDLLTTDTARFSAIAEELRVVYPFTIR